MDTAAASSSYPDSVESSPRSRGGESWDDLFPSAAAAAKLRFMCSYGGQIVPRPHDKSLCYLGGETRIVVVDRHSTLADLSAKLSRSLLGGRPFSIKYQLPSEDLDSLISVTTDEDLDNMLEEYDRILASSSHGGSNSSSNSSSAGTSGKPARLRLFLFPFKLESPAGSIGSLIDDSKTETWFVDALNGAIGVGSVLPRVLSADSTASSVNCLLGLEEERNHLSYAATAANAGPPVERVEQERHHHHKMQMPHTDSAGKLDYSSSFGSTSSAPSPSNLPPIRVRPDDRIIDQRVDGEGLEEPFSQMNISELKQEEGFTDGGYNAQYQQQYIPPLPINHIPFSTAAMTASSVPPIQNPNNGPIAFSDDEKPDFGRINRMPQPQQQFQQPQQRPNTYNAPVFERSVYLSPASDAKQEGQYIAPESSYRVQMQVSEQGYMLPMQQPEQLHPQQQQQQQEQQQFHHQQQQQQQEQQQQQLHHQQQQQQQEQQQQQLHQQQQQQEQQQQQLQQQQHQEQQQQQLQQQQQQEQQQQQLQQQQEQQQLQQQLHHHHHHQQLLQQQQLQQQQQQQLPYFHPNSHLVQHPNSVPAAAVQAYYQMHHPIPTQQQLPQAHSYNQQVPMYYVQVRPPSSTPYVLPMQQQSLVDNSPFPSSTKPTQTVSALPPQGVAPLKPEQVTTANIYRNNSASPTAVAQPCPSPQLIHLPDQSHQFMGYHTMHHQPSQPPAAPNHGYDQQPMYYTHASSAMLPAQYQTMSSVGVAISDVHHPQLQQADGKQNRAS